MIRLALFSLILAAGLGQTQPIELPDELSHLNALVSQEKDLLDAARAYDKAQCLLAEGELREAKQLKEAGQADESKAKQEQASRRFRQVRTAYEFVLQHYPRNPRVKTYYGEVLYDRFGDFDAAVKNWEEAVVLDPRLATPYNDLGIHYCHSGEYAKGLQYYDKALELDPENADYLFNIVQTYLTNFPEVQRYRKWDKAKVYREAMKLSKKALKLSPGDFEFARDYALNFFTAENFGVKADWKDAGEAWQRARELARNDAERFNAWLNEARAWTRAENKTKARACIEEALKIQPGNAVAEKLLADLSSGTPAKKQPAKTNVKQPSSQ